MTAAWCLNRSKTDGNRHGESDRIVPYSVAWGKALVVASQEFETGRNPSQDRRYGVCVATHIRGQGCLSLQGTTTMLQRNFFLGDDHGNI